MKFKNHHRSDSENKDEREEKRLTADNHRLIGTARMEGHIETERDATDSLEAIDRNKGGADLSAVTARH